MDWHNFIVILQRLVAAAVVGLAAAAGDENKIITGFDVI
jgi:hypothetical protein